MLFRSLAEALTTLDAGESWLVEPRVLDPSAEGDDLWAGEEDGLGAGAPASACGEGDGDPAGGDCRGAGDGVGRGVRWTPGVKLGVRPGSRFHMTECFGPVLGVMRADDLDHAIRLQNMPLFGLTGGIHSLDDREVDRWLAGVEVGNAYVNRPITGAIVRRQPFGGWKRSAIGAGAKAGGPNYVLTLGTWRSPTPTPAAPVPDAGVAAGRSPSSLEASMAGDHDPAGGVDHDLERWWRDEFAVEHDPSGLRAESNVLRYRPLPHGVVLRAGSDVTDAEVRLAVAAAQVTGVRLLVSTQSPRPSIDQAAEAKVDVPPRPAVDLPPRSAIDVPPRPAVARPAAPQVDVVVETAAELAARLPGLQVDRLRIPGHVPDELRAAAHSAELALDDAPVVAHGRIELLHWLREQAISRTLHRYGNLPDRP